jgi:hypothetical protein
LKKKKVGESLPSMFVDVLLGKIIGEKYDNISMRRPSY